MPNYTKYSKRIEPGNYSNYANQATPANHTIVVGEENARLAHVVSILLSREGYNVFTATDGEAALSLLLAQRPDAALLDVQMSKLDGIEVCARAKKLLPDTYIIMWRAVCQWYCRRPSAAR